jgi:hypothetical protein
VAFTWRHWGEFTGGYKGHKGEGELIEMYGFGTAVVNGKLQLCECEFYFDAKNFLDAMEGKIPASRTGASTLVGPGGCPFQGAAGAAAAGAGCPFR